MVLGLLKYVSMKRKKEVIIKIWTFYKRKVHSKKKGRVREF